MATKAQEALKLLTRPEGCTNSELAKVLGRRRANVKGYARRRWKLAMKVEKAETRYTADGKPGTLEVPPRKRKSKTKPETETVAVAKAKATRERREGVKQAGDPGPELLAALLPRVGGKTPKRLATPAELAARKADKKALADVPASLRIKPIAKQEAAKTKIDRKAKKA